MELAPDIQNIRSAIVSENQYIYTLSAPSNTKAEGLRLYNTNSLCDDDGISSSNFLCRESLVMCNDFIDYSRTTERFTYLKDLTTLEVIPLPHKTTIFFIGMPDRENIVSAKQDKDIFRVLTFRGEIYTWSVTTGKLLEYHRNCIPNLEEYQIYSSEGSLYTYLSLNLEYTLIRSKAKTEGAPFEKFFHKSSTEIRTPGS